MKVLTRDITVPNSTASLEQVRQFVSSFLAESSFGERDRRLLVLAIDETVTSNIRFSEAMDRRGDSTVSLDLTEDCLRVRIVDTGQDRDPDSTEGFEAHVRRTRQYEMGIFLVQQIMDEIHYIFRKGFQNEMELVRFVYRKRETGP
jgi:anti-sigma regulatory factor (Ser/Thr protein kinase)